jgi:hypothetical protein
MTAARLSPRFSPEARMPEKDERYLDENLTDKEKESGRTRLPMPEEEGTGSGKKAKEPATTNPDRSDEFGDGDRRS